MNARKAPALAVGLGLGLLLTSLAAAALAGDWLVRSDGAELFDGRRPLVARIAGHDEALPPLASRCANCHTGPQAVGGELTGATLASERARRGGPPSRYDAARLCRVLREGIDPAHVVVAKEMPRYAIADGACAALWAHLSQR